jgi:hypothetical protein
MENSINQSTYLEISPQFDYDTESKGIINLGGEILFLIGANVLLISQSVWEGVEKLLWRAPK